MSMMVSLCAVFFPRGVLDEILNLIESVSEGLPSYSCWKHNDLVDLSNVIVSKAKWSKYPNHKSKLVK